jgi:hypothetical protein
VEAINAFRQDHGLLPLLVCSRIADYEALGAQLRLQGALVVQPLTRPQVEDYLTQVGQPVAAVRQALQEDATLWEVLDTPLMLTVVSLAYVGKPTEALRTDETLEVKRQHLFAAYVDRMFQHRGIMTRYTPQQTVHWLAWLAWQLTRYSQTVFYLERIQPIWIYDSPIWMPPKSIRRRGGLLGRLLVWLAGELLFGRPREQGDILDVTQRRESVFLSVFLKEIRSVETLRWSWSAFSAQLPLIFTIVLLFGLLGGLGGGLGGVRGGLGGGLRDALVGGMICGLLGGFVGGVIGALKALSGDEIETKTVPNQGIHRSARNALRIGLLGGLLGGLTGGLVGGMMDVIMTGELSSVTGPITIGLLGGLACGLLGLTSFGGNTYLRHFHLRLTMVWYDLAPWHYVAFLDYAAERILLRKVGGGYMFIHRLLQDHFATRYSELDRNVHQESSEWRPTAS